VRWAQLPVSFPTTGPGPGLQGGQRVKANSENGSVGRLSAVMSLDDEILTEGPQTITASPVSWDSDPAAACSTLGSGGKDFLAFI
jgi:hypothetical protein